MVEFLVSDTAPDEFGLLHSFVRAHFGERSLGLGNQISSDPDGTFNGGERNRFLPRTVSSRKLGHVQKTRDSSDCPDEFAAQSVMPARSPNPESCGSIHASKLRRRPRAVRSRVKTWAQGASFVS